MFAGHVFFMVQKIEKDQRTEKLETPMVSLILRLHFQNMCLASGSLFMICSLKLAQRDGRTGSLCHKPSFNNLIKLFFWLRSTVWIIRERPALASHVCPPH